MGKKLSNEVVDKRLLDSCRTIQRLGEYIDTSTKIHWGCLVKDCGCIWSATPAHIISSKNTKNCRGCPRCGGHILLTNDIVDERLQNRPIKRIDNYINSDTKINWKCLVENCNCIWFTTPNSIFNGSECPACYGNMPLANEIVDIRLSNRSIKRLGNYIDSITKINWKCLVENCNYIWKTTPNSILDQQSGCPKCAKVVKLTNEIVDNRLLEQNRPIKRIGNIINCEEKIEWECLNGGHIWSATPTNILNHNRGCKFCKNKNETLLYNTLQKLQIEFEYQTYLKNIDTTQNNLYRIDFYFPKLKFIIELNGRQHYEPRCFGGISLEQAKHCFIKQQERDQYIRDFCQINNIRLLEIDGRKYQNNQLIKYIYSIFEINYVI